MNRIELVKTLELVKPALATTNMIPIFQCFTFDQGTVSAYNDQIAIIGPTDFDVGGSVAIHGNTLLGLLSNSSVKEAEFAQKGNEVIVTMGKSVSKLPFQPEENFLFHEPEEAWRFKLPYTENFNEAIRLCLETVSVDTTQTGLMGITLEDNLMYSCNGDCLTRIKLKSKSKDRVLMPTAFCEAATKLWATLEMTSGTLYFNDEWVMVDFEEWLVFGRVLEISEPIDFVQLIKKTVKGGIPPCYPFPDGFSEALSRARVLADPESQKKDDFKLEGHSDVVANINASHLQKALESCIGIAILENCTILEAPDVFKLVSNMS